MTPLEHRAEAEDFLHTAAGSLLDQPAEDDALALALIAIGHALLAGTPVPEPDGDEPTLAQRVLAEKMSRRRA